MTDALMDRIKAHRSAPTVYDPPTFDQMADRIEQLERENARLDAGWTDANARALAARLEVIKVVKALRDTTQMLSQCTFTTIRIKGQYLDRHEVIDEANSVLAKMEGKE